MKLFDVKFQCIKAPDVIDVGNVVVVANTQAEATDVVLQMLELPRSRTRLTFRQMAFGFVVTNRRTLNKPAEVIQEQSMPDDIIDKREREIAMANGRLQAKKEKSLPALGLRLQKFLVSVTATVRALDEFHAQRSFAEEMMSRAGRWPKTERGVSGVILNVSSLLDKSYA